VQAVYLDNNATTRTDPEVVAAMLPYFTEHFGNASSTHSFGADVAGAIRQARRQVQELIGAAYEGEIVFTSGGTESDNAALLCGVEIDSGRNEIIVSKVEHPAILAFAAYLEHMRGIRVHQIGVDGEGRLDIDAYAQALGPRTALASIMWANNETGTVFPVAELAEMAHAAGALFHTDAVQAAGRVPVSVTGTKIDLLSLSGHKLHAPKGTGALYVRKGIAFKPLIRGGRQERGRRAGTENGPGIVGLGKAAELATRALGAETARVRGMRDRLEQGVLQRIGQCLVSGDTESRLPNTSNIAFSYADSEALLHQLEAAGIAASSGSACASGSMEPSHVLRAMNVPPIALQGAIRFSLSRDNSNGEIDRLLDILPGIVAAVREKSPLWRDVQASDARGVSSLV